MIQQCISEHEAVIWIFGSGQMIAGDEQPCGNPFIICEWEEIDGMLVIHVCCFIAVHCISGIHRMQQQ